MPVNSKSSTFTTRILSNLRQYTFQAKQTTQTRCCGKKSTKLTAPDPGINRGTPMRMRGDQMTKDLNANPELGHNPLFDLWLFITTLSY